MIGCKIRIGTSEKINRSNMEIKIYLNTSEYIEKHKLEISSTNRNMTNIEISRQRQTLMKAQRIVHPNTR